MEALHYADGWAGGILGRQRTVVPRAKFPFGNTVTPDSYTRIYERDFDIVVRGYLPRITARTAWTNLVLHSEDLTETGWTATNATPTIAAGTAPDGEATLNKLLETVTSGEHSLAQTVSVAAVETEASVFAAGGLTRRKLKLSFTDSAATVFSAVFDFVSGEYSSASAGVSAKVVSLGNGHFQLVLRFTPAAGSGTLKVALVSTGATTSYVGVTSAGAYLWGAQISAGVGAPYISTTSTTRSILAPDRDPVDPFAYLIEETDPDGGSSETAIVRRTFCRIPRQQTLPSSRFVTKPDLPGEFPQVSGNSLIIQPEENVPRWIFYTQIPVTTDSGPPGSGSYPTGGTYTITVGADTTAAIAFNASAATLASALNSLSSVSDRGTMAVTGSYTTGFTLSLAYNNGSVNAGSLTGAGGFTGGATSINKLNVTQYAVRINALPGGATFTGGTFTLTLFGQTTSAIAFNASTATVKAAISALSHVGSSLVVVNNLGVGAGYSGTSILNNSANEIGFSIDIEFPAISASGSSLTPSGSTAISAPGAGAGTNSHFTAVSFTGVVLATRVLSTQSPHGITTADSIVVTQGSNFRTIPAGSFSATANTITFTAAVGLALSDPTLITAVGASTANSYTAGSKLTRIKKVTDFYLIGVSPGISSLDDVPLPDYQGDSASLLAAIFNGDTSINYEVGELEAWRNGPIVMRTRTTLNAATL